MRPKLTVLQDTLMLQILDEAKRILNEIGLEVQSPHLHQRLLDHGLKQDPASERVLFPPSIVDKAIADTPRSFILYNRSGIPHADIGEDRVHFVPGSSGLKVLDYNTGQARLAQTADFVEYVRLADGLEDGVVDLCHGRVS